MDDELIDHPGGEAPQPTAPAEVFVPSGEEAFVPSDEERRARVQREARLLAAVLAESLRAHRSATSGAEAPRAAGRDGTSYPDGASSAGTEPVEAAPDSSTGTPAASSAPRGQAPGRTAVGTGDAEEVARHQPSADQTDTTRPDSAAVSEILTGAGLVARGGLELMTGVMSRLAEASTLSPEDHPREGREGREGSETGVRTGREAAGPPRLVGYRRSPRRPVPVIDDPERSDLA